jgi:hypothetical protein
MTHHPLICKVFGSVKPESREIEFSKTAWQAMSGGAPGAHVLPRGALQKVRGLQIVKEGMILRPDLLSIDDILDPQQNYTDEQRLKIKQWFFGSIGSVIDRGSMELAPEGMFDWEKLVIGTITHYDDILINLIDDPTWEIVKIPLMDEYYKSLSPGYMTDEETKKLADNFAVHGQLDSLAVEYQCLPGSPQEQEVTDDMFIYHDSDSVNPEDLADMFYVTIVDPAKTKKLTSADSAIVTIGVNLIKSMIYIRDITAEKMHPDELIAKTLNQAELYESMYLGVETTSLEEWITQPFEDEISRRDLNFEFIEIKARGDKIDRITSFAGQYRKGVVVHHRGRTAKLELQMKTYKKSKLKDIADACAHIFQVMNKIGLNFFVAKEGVLDMETIEEMLESYTEPEIEGWEQYD